MCVMSNQLKENINRIKSIINECGCSDSSKGEGNMAKHQAMECSSDSADVSRMISSDMDLPEWLEAKITLSAEYMNVVKDYLTHQMGVEDNGQTINISYDDDSMEYEIGEQDDGTGTGESDDGAGAGTASVGVWDSGVARGIANQITNSKWADSYATTRGKANPLI